MARITLELTEEHIKLIKCFRFQKINVKHEKSNIIPDLKYMFLTLEECDNNECSDYIKDELKEKLEKIYDAASLSNMYAESDTDKYYGFDTYDFFGGDLLYEQMAYILGYQDQIIPGTEEDYDGPKFPPEVMEHFKDLMEFIFTRIVDIEDVLHQRCDKGGLQANVKYIAYDYERLWFTEEEFKEHRKKKRNK